MRQRPGLLHSISLWSLGVAARSVLALAYTVLLARLLSLQDFAAWGVIVALGNAAALISRPLGFWAPRLGEHGRPPGVAWTTGLLGSMVQAILVLAAVYTMAEEVSALLGLEPGHVRAGASAVALAVVYGFTQLFMQSWRPEREPLGMILFEAVRILGALVPALTTGLTYSIAVASHAAGMAAYILYTGVVARPSRPDPVLVAEWLSKWRAPVVEGLATFLINLVRPAVSAVAGPGPVAYLNIGLSLSRVLFQVLMGVSWNVYSRLLSSSRVDVEKAAGGLLLLAGLAIVGIAGLSEYIAWLFGPEYEGSGPVIMVLAARSAVNSIGVLYARVIQARGDLNAINRTASILLAIQSSSLLLGAIASMMGASPLEQAVNASLGMTAPSLAYTASMILLARNMGFPTPPIREAVAAGLGLLAGCTAWLAWPPLAPIAYTIIVLIASPFARSLASRLRALAR